MKTKIQYITMICIVFLPSMVLANAGTPLMWVSAFHLLFGNAIIGVIEGLLLSWLFKARLWKSILIIVIANYISAWVGWMLIIQQLSEIPDITIENISFWFWLFVIAAFVFTLIIEFPFYWFSLRKKKRAAKLAIKSTLIINGITYILLFSWYWMVSGTSIMTDLDVVSANDLCPQEQYDLYFITSDGNQVVKTDLAGKGVKIVSKVSATYWDDRLFVRRDTEGRYDLFIHLGSDERENEKEAIILRDFSDLAPIDPLIAEGHSERSEGTGFSFGPVPSIASDTDWEYRTGFWAIEGISGENKKENLRFYFSLETPIESWLVQNATQIEGDYVVFQLGYDQICILHPQTKKIAMIARGKGPIVAKPKMGNK